MRFFLPIRFEDLNHEPRDDAMELAALIRQVLRIVSGADREEVLCRLRHHISKELERISAREPQS